ncbi:hypothetical protein [Actinoplanes sp. NPDC020271]|uniref:hypothetical protein n=1 Tax=Actinoplanes sp. NPDC020271 TaxID=3363896 RepID=UPI0037956891
MPGSSRGTGSAVVPGNVRGTGAAAVPGSAGSAAVPGRGTGSASVPGTATVPGRDNTSGLGNGPGPGNGPGQGNGPGLGNGPGQGNGPGPGQGTAPGQGNGSGRGNTPGQGNGPGRGSNGSRGNAPGFGTDSGFAKRPPAGGDPFDEPGHGTGTIAVARAGAPKAGTAATPVRAKGFEAGAEEEAEAEGGLAELRQKLRTQRRLRLITLSTLAAVVLLVLPAFFGLRAVSSDPVFASLDSLSVPAWADEKPEDQGSGSRWCFLECRFRERMADSQRDFKETTQAYTKALEAAGWTLWKVADCPESPVKPEEGTYTCFRRDEFTLDLAVGLPDCAVDQVLQEAVPAAGSEQAEAGRTGTGKCGGSTVSIKVRTAIADERGKTDKNPGPVGQTPDPVLDENDPLLNPTPQAS